MAMPAGGARGALALALSVWKNKKRAAHRAHGPPERPVVLDAAPTAIERTNDQPPVLDAPCRDDETDCPGVPPVLDCVPAGPTGLL